MISNRIVLKLGGTIILLFLIVLLPVGFVVNQVFSSFYYNQVRTETSQLASQYATTIARSPTPMAVSMIEMMAGFSQVKMYIVDDRGVIIANANVPYVTKGSVIPQEEVIALSQGKSIDKEFTDPLRKDRYLVSGTSIRDNHGFYGGVYVVSSVEGINQSLEKVRGMLVISGIGAFFLALGFTYVLSKKLSSPLIQMEQATRKIAKGDLGIRVKAESKDEIGSLAQAINDLAFDLQKYRDSRREFFANISHELRTPMTYLKGYANVLKEKLYQTEEEKDQYLDIIYQESIRLTAMIEDLFELSKMEEGKIQLTLEWIDLSEIIESAVQKTRLQASEKGLVIQSRIQDDLPLVHGDRHRMAQIFINLLDNAIRYTSHGTISVKVWRNFDRIKIYVEDTGIGIPEEELPYIFDRFYRVEKSRSREFGGTGLGLAIVKNLVELQGGTIQVSSEKGKGTRFELTFPISSYTDKEEEG